MTVFIAILLTLLTFGFIIYPLYRQKSATTDSAQDEEREELRSRRNATYSMLKELEFDYHSGVLSEEDYRELQEKYKQQAVSILKEADELDKSDRIEDDIEKQVAQLRQQRGFFCSQCGTKSLEGDRFCSNCGAELR